MSATLEASIRFIPTDAEINRGFVVGIPVGIAGMIGAMAATQSHDQYALYSQLQRKENDLQSMLTTLEAFDQNPVLKTVGADPKKIEAAEARIESQITSIQARKPDQLSKADTVGAMMGGALGGLLVGAAITVVGMRLNQRVRAQESHLAGTLSSLSEELVYPGRRYPERHNQGGH